MTLLQILRMTEEEARAFLEELRWPNGSACPHCGNEGDNYRLSGKSHRPGVHKCKACRKQFTVTTNTIMHRSHIPLTKWVAAFYMMVSSKKGISAHQIHRTLDITYKTAWFLCHRIRHAMKTEEYASALMGTVEVDETYVGGKPRRGGEKSKRGRGTMKIPVVALIQRDGEARTMVVDRVDGKSLKGAIRKNVDRKARIVTDEFTAYKGIGKEFEGGHHTVNHGRGEYSRGDIYTNTAESYFALLKRGVVGTFHHVSKEHLDRYCDEFSFRWNYRKVTDFERLHAALRLVQGRRLIYA